RHTRRGHRRVSARRTHQAYARRAGGMGSIAPHRAGAAAGRSARAVGARRLNRGFQLRTICCSLAGFHNRQGGCLMARIVTRSFAATATRPAPRPAVPLVVTTAAPTPQFRQHHNVEAPQVDSTAFRQGWRVTTRLDALLEAGRIDKEQWEAARE